MNTLTETSHSNLKMLTGLLFRLLPVQILLAAVGAVNGIVSSYFASNYVGVDAMSAVGLYSPVNMLISSFSMILVGGSVILCGEYMGKNRRDSMQGVFSLNIMLSLLIASAFTVIYIILAISDMTGFITRDPVIRPLFNRYLLGQAAGLIPFMLGNSFASFLSLENRGKVTLAASVTFIAVNLLLNYLFVFLLRLNELGLALASSLGMWVFMGVQLPFFLSGKTSFRFSPGRADWRESGSVIRIGLPGALTYVYQTVRGLIVNKLMEIYIGSVAISAFATSDYVMRIFWAVPTGMIAVSRMMISVSAGEEDRQTLADVMRVMFRRFIPLQCIISAAIILCAVPFTGIFYHDASAPVFAMTAAGLRILPLCMPFSIICMHFTCYAQVSGKHLLVHLLSVLDGVVCVAGFSALLIRLLGINSVYIANVLNGIVTTLVVIVYAWIRKGHFPRSMEELMVIPDDFGAPEEQRMDISLHSMEEVVSVAESVQNFCLSRGIDSRRSNLAGLAMEEMAGNIIDHGFKKDKKPNSVDIRVVHKDDDVILRIKDDCVPFDPGERLKMTSNENAGSDPMKNIGIRMVYKIARDIQYQNVLGLNVLTLKI
ncbi:MAG: ATP-binding protein [Oscillospiraceae bacterium]|nr:ATP-binding protein [Oscillospiraceae bacterium]